MPDLRTVAAPCGGRHPVARQVERRVEHVRGREADAAAAGRGLMEHLQRAGSRRGESPRRAADALGLEQLGAMSRSRACRASDPRSARQAAEFLCAMRAAICAARRGDGAAQRPAHAAAAEEPPARSVFARNHWAASAAFERARSFRLPRRRTRRERPAAAAQRRRPPRPRATSPRARRGLDAPALLSTLGGGRSELVADSTRETRMVAATASQQHRAEQQRQQPAQPAAREIATRCCRPASSTG